MNEGRTGAASPGEFRVLIQPNRSMNPRGMVWCVAGLAALSVAIATGFLIAGAWWVLPFTGLELTLVAGVFWIVYRRGFDYELLVIDEETVQVTRKRGAVESRSQFLRYWTRVELRRGAHRWHPSRLLIGSHGKRVEIGGCMTESERRALSDRLADWVAPVRR